LDLEKVEAINESKVSVIPSINKQASNNNPAPPTQNKGKGGGNGGGGNVILS